MATVANLPVSSAAAPAPRLEPPIPRLESGDHLSRAEFERRYLAMPSRVKAELIEGIVYMPSPVRLSLHGKPHSWIMGWLTQYEAETPGTESADNATIRLDLANEPQPDGLLRLRESHGGQSQLDADGYVVGSPELVVEITSSSVSYDLHEKKRAYHRNGVCEYLVWMVEEERIAWWALRDGEYVPLEPDPNGVLRSGVFPGLWLDAPALLRGELSQVLETVRAGARSPEHEAFANKT
jgi:Uma2 family endonuclease